jgi:hypothetical protein
VLRRELVEISDVILPLCLAPELPIHDRRPWTCSHRLKRITNVFCLIEHGTITFDAISSVSDFCKGIFLYATWHRPPYPLAGGDHGLTCPRSSSTTWAYIDFH